MAGGKVSVEIRHSSGCHERGGACDACYREGAFSERGHLPQTLLPVSQGEATRVPIPRSSPRESSRRAPVPLPSALT